MKELKDIFPEEHEIKLGKKIVKVKDFCVGDLPVIMDIASKVQNALVKSKGDIGTALIDVIKDDFDSLLKAVSLSASIDIKELKKLNQTAFIFVASEVVEVNYDFFMEKVQPQIAKLTETLNKKNPPGQK